MALYENYHAQSYFLRVISLPAAHMNAVLALVLLALGRCAISAVPVVCARSPCAGAAISRLAAHRIQTDDLAATPEQTLLQYLLPSFEQKHAVQILVVLGLAYAAVVPIQGAIVYHPCANEVFPVPVAVHFPVLAQLGQDVPAAILA